MEFLNINETIQSAIRITKGIAREYGNGCYAPPYLLLMLYRDKFNLVNEIIMWNLLKYQSLSSHFYDVKDLNVKEVGRKIGGKVEVNTEAMYFENACALRMSYALTMSGITIPYCKGCSSSGRDGKWYLYKVVDVIKLINEKLREKPLISTSQKYKEDFKGKQGIIVFTNCVWRDATGHVDLFDGYKVEGKSSEHECGNV